MENLVILDGNLYFVLRNKTDMLLNWGTELSEAHPKQLYILNVSRGNFAAYIFFVIVKNIIACHGLSNLIPKCLTVLLLMTLSCSKLAFLDGFSDRIFTLTAWAIVLFLQVFSGFIGFPSMIQYLISAAGLSAMIIFSPTYSSEFVLDVFFIATLIFYIFKSMWQPFVIIFEWLALVIMAIVFLLAVDSAFGFERVIFHLTSNYVILFATFFVAVFHNQRGL